MEEFYASKEDLKIIAEKVQSSSIRHQIMAGKAKAEKAHGERVEAKARRGVDEQRRRESWVSRSERRRGWTREV